MGAPAGTNSPFLCVIGVFKEISYVEIPQIFLLDVSAVPCLNSEKDIP